MTRHAIPSRRTPAHRFRRKLGGRAATASALAGGCLAVVVLWTTAAGKGATGTTER